MSGTAPRSCVSTRRQSHGGGTGLNASLHKGSIAVSAVFEEGLEQIADAVVEGLATKRETVSLWVPYAKWDIAFELKRAGTLRSEVHDDEGAVITIDLRPEDAERYSRVLGIRKP